MNAGLSLNILGEKVIVGPRGVIGPILIAGIAVSPCQARDVAKVQAAEASQPCAGYGNGFVRAPGGSTCVRLSGRVRAGADIRVGHEAAAAPAASGRFAIDTRTESDLGPIRTFVSVGNGRR